MRVSFATAASALLFLLFENPSASLAAECPKAEYEARLKSVGFSDVTSVQTAVGHLVTLSKGQDDACKEQLVLLFREYHYAALGKYSDSMELLNISEANEPELNKKLAPAGWRIASTEGNYYIAEAAEWPLTALNEALPPSYKRYFELRSKEIAQGFSEDAGLLITWEQLRSRIISWEAFLADYPGFVEKFSVDAYLDVYIRVYLTGMDNSRVFGFEKNRLEKAVQESYERFIAENKKSGYYPLVSDYYDYLKKHDFVEPSDLNEFLEKKGVKSFLAIQPPTY